MKRLLDEEEVAEDGEIKDGTRWKVSDFVEEVLGEDV